MKRSDADIAKMLFDGLWATERLGALLGACEVPGAWQVEEDGPGDAYSVDEYDKSIELFFIKDCEESHSTLAAAGFEKVWFHRGKRTGWRACTCCDRNDRCPVVYLKKAAT